MKRYSIKLVDMNNKPLSSRYHLAILKQGKPVFEGESDNTGHIFFNAEIVKGQLVSFEIWNKEFPKNTRSITEELLWDSNCEERILTPPTVYNIKLKKTENANNEAKEYSQAKYMGL